MQVFKNKIFLSFFVFIVFIFLVIFGSINSLGDVDSQKPAKVTNYAIETLQQSIDSKFENICDYKYDITENTAIQNCTNLYRAKTKYMIVSFEFYAEAKFGEISIIDQDNNKVDAKIISSSYRAYEVGDYVNRCNSYCPATRLFLQFELPSNRQLKGIQIKDFIFKKDVKILPIIGFDPSNVKINAIYSDVEIKSYEGIREAIELSSPQKRIINKLYVTPIGAKGDGLNLNKSGVDLALDFINVEDSLERGAFNSKHHSTSIAECYERLNRDSLNNVSVVDVCTYLVQQYRSVNQFGKGNFDFNLHLNSLPSFGSKPITIDSNTPAFFEEFLINASVININLEKESDLTEDQINILKIAYFTSPTSTINKVKYFSKDATEERILSFLEDFSLEKIEELDLSDNNITFTSKSNLIIFSIPATILDLENNNLLPEVTFLNTNEAIQELNVKNTNWSRVSDREFWTKVPNVSRLRLTGTDVKNLTLEEFSNILTTEQVFSMTLFEAELKDSDVLEFEDFQEAFVALKTLNTPLSKFVINDIDKFKENVLSFSGDFGIPINNIIFGIVDVEKVFEASNALINKLKDLEGNNISLYYDAYLSFFLKDFLNKREFFQEGNFEVEKIEKAIKSVIGSYQTLFDVANFKSNESDSAQTKTARVQGEFEKVAGLVEAKIKGEVLSKYIEENKSIISELRLNDIPDTNFTDKVIIISILMSLLVWSFIWTNLVFIFKFKKS